MTRKYKVGIDADGVLYDLVTPWLNQYNKIAGTKLQLNDITEYDITKFVQSPEALFYILETEQFWDEIKPYDGVNEALDLLNQCNNVDYYIVSHTFAKTATIKFRKIFDMLPILNDEQLILTKHKELINLDFLIDDYPENIKQTNGVGILIDQPYNQYHQIILRQPDLLSAVKFIISSIN